MIYWIPYLLRAQEEKRNELALECRRDGVKRAGQWSSACFDWSRPKVRYAAFYLIFCLGVNCITFRSGAGSDVIRAKLRDRKAGFAGAYLRAVAERIVVQGTWLRSLGVMPG
jgi:hypothetical protein